MSTSPVINSLRRKRAEISGSIRELDARIHDLRRDLAHIDATLKLFDPSIEPRAIKPVRPWRPANRIFERKELTVRVLTALREAEGAPLTLEAIAERIVRDKHLESVAGATVRRVSAIALRALVKRGVVTTPDGKQWAIA
jgi:hypothetical protein